MLPTRRAALGAAVSLALLLGACSSSGGDDDAADTTTTEADETTTTEAEETTTTEAEVDEEALARAESIFLDVGDFGEGWVAEPADEETDDDEPNPLTDCSPLFDEEENSLATHTSDDITFGSLDDLDGSALSAESKIFVDEQAATEALDVFNDPEVVSCIDAALKELYSGLTGLPVQGELSEDDLGLDVELGLDQSEGISAEYALEFEDGTTADLLIAVLTMRKGDAGVLVLINSIGGNLEYAELEGPITALAERVAAA